MTVTVTQTVYVVVCEDRHSDDSITVHATRGAADAKVERQKAADYYDDVEWVEETVPERQTPWVRYVSSHEDGPKIRIEKHEMEL